MRRERKERAEKKKKKKKKRKKEEEVDAKWRKERIIIKMAGAMGDIHYIQTSWPIRDEHTTSSKYT